MTNGSGIATPNLGGLSDSSVNQHNGKVMWAWRGDCVDLKRH